MNVRPDDRRVWRLGASALFPEDCRKVFPVGPLLRTAVAQADYLLMRLMRGPRLDKPVK
jgi:hypothetical protein